MKTVTIDGVEYNLLQATCTLDACDRCDVRNYCRSSQCGFFAACTSVKFGYLKRITSDNAHLEVCCSAGGGHSEYLKRVSDADSVDVTCEELARKLDPARTALALIYGGVKVCRTIGEIRSLCARTLEETK